MEDVTIIQIFVAPGNTALNQMDTLYGLGDDGLPYVWMNGTGWRKKN